MLLFLKHIGQDVVDIAPLWMGTVIQALCTTGRKQAGLLWVELGETVELAARQVELGETVELAARQVERSETVGKSWCFDQSRPRYGRVSRGVFPSNSTQCTNVK